MKKSAFLIMAFATLCWLIPACACRRQSQSRHYEESGADAPSAPSSAAIPAPEGAWHWKSPAAWAAETGAGLRLATFTIPAGGSNEGTGQCTVVPLPGDGGGVEANVRRWLVQLGQPMLSPSELEDFLGRQERMRTAGGVPFMVIDFTTLAGAPEPAGASMLVAVIPAQDQTLFVKMSGGRTLLESNREAFREFCRSFFRGG